MATVANANTFLETTYWADHNRRFAQAPTSADDFHVAVPRGVRLDHVFRLEEKRTVANDWVVRYDNRLLQLERQSRLPPARSTVLVYEDIAGQLEVRYRDRVVRWTEVPVAARARPTLPAAPSTSSGLLDARVRGRRAGGDHPWRAVVEEYHMSRQLAKDRRAWMAGQP